MSVFKQILIVLVLFVAVLGAEVLYRQHAANDAETGGPRKPRVTRVELATAKSGAVLDQVEAVGTTLARQAVNVVPLVSGRIVDIAFKPGQHVRAGDVLVRLDDAAERATVAETAAVAKEAKLAFERASKLKIRKTVTQATLDKLEAAVVAADARLALMQKRLDDRTVRAAFDGVVGLQRVYVGARVDEDTVLTTLDDLSQVEINFSVPEIHFARIREGQPVTAITTVFKDRVFNGRVADIDSRIQASSRSFRVRAILPNPGGILPAGMFMHVSVLIGEERAVLIPEEAVIAEGAGTFVFVVDGDRARRRDVALGRRTRGFVAVLDGLSDGEAVVRSGHHRLRDGSVVQVNKTRGKAVTAIEEAGS